MGLQGWKQGLIRRLHFLNRWKQITAEQLIGLDIGPRAIKLLKMEQVEDSGWVDAFSMVPLPSGAIAKDEIKDAGAVSAALRLAFETAQVKSKNVALAIPRASAIIKTINISSKLSEADIESRAWVEANRHFPDLVGDIYLDFDVIGPSAQDPSQLELLLVACRKDQVKPYLDLLQEGGYNVKVIDVNCYALERALSLMRARFADLKTMALLNLDYGVSSLIVVHEGQLIYAHDHTYEGANFAAQVVKFLEAHPELNNDADALLNNTEYQDLLKAGISAHLRHSMHFFYSSRPHITIQKLVLGGDCAPFPSLNTFIQKETGIETLVANPFEGMQVSSAVDSAVLEKNASSLMLCCGLALSRTKEGEA